ncbi:Thioredoxin domain-containing protein 3-like protein [Camponotus floridanus]|uniref:Thioredoxin domain-containing protein 3-like protein n=1 Tax=Camponotus floridanus TaxID=104421 RepID=E2AIG1_CAMFO|nr:Thioredoxin domain-containing protein 3-like protein [Camponotus floridanus]
MAKKVAPTALQTEVINDEEWAKVLTRKVVDVYSDWSGPCTGMVSILKKIKMEIGGDALSYATANCDRVTDLKRFQGKSEPIWMFIHERRMINLMFGAHCPQFIQMLTTELDRIQNGGEHEFSIDVSEKSPEEVTRLKIQEEAKIAKEIAKKSRKEAETKARYEAEMLHLTTSLCNETCLLLFPWIFKDEEGRRRDKRMSPQYVELIEEILPENYTVEQEIRKRLNEDLLRQMLDESTYSFSETAKQLLFDGKCMFIRLKIIEGRKNLEVHNYLCSILFNEPTLPETDECLNEECYEVFVCTVKKVGCEAFLGFAGIGPYHVSENPEKAIEESKLYFPDVTAVEETQSDDEEKLEELEEHQDDTAAT